MQVCRRRNANQTSLREDVNEIVLRTVQAAIGEAEKPVAPSECTERTDHAEKGAAAVERGRKGASGGPEPTAATAGVTPVKARLSGRWLAGLGGAALVVAALGVGMFRWFGGGAAPMVVVLPFQNLGPPDDEYFADGITDAITARLARMGGLGVISRTSAVLYKSTSKSPQQISEELGVQYVLEGTVQRERPSDRML